MLNDMKIYTRALREQDKLKNQLISSNTLLNNMLPRHAVEELKAHRFNMAEEFKEVSVLFTDIVGKEI